ncbi:CSS-motif domain-containing protein [Marinomonas sp. RS-M-Aa-14]|uniref:CSS-motif domain-containing protein n=1 Tax=Marinomonas sp. RS-M-Aa-14 TaxID=3241169 RepID=UPI003AAA3A8B
MAKNALSEHMESIFAELQQVADNSAFVCERADVDRLRRATFYSPIFKEFGLFNADFKVYCSNLGAINISIYKSIVSRIKDSKDRKTVSLMDSNTLGESTFLLSTKGLTGWVLMA